MTPLCSFITGILVGVWLLAFAIMIGMQLKNNRENEA